MLNNAVCNANRVFFVPHLWRLLVLLERLPKMQVQKIDLLPNTKHQRIIYQMNTTLLNPEISGKTLSLQQKYQSISRKERNQSNVLHPHQYVSIPQLYFDIYGLLVLLVLPFQYRFYEFPLVILMFDKQDMTLLLLLRCQQRNHNSELSQNSVAQNTQYILKHIKLTKFGISYTENPKKSSNN